MGVELSNSRPIVKAASACVWRGEDVLLIQRGSALGNGRWSLPGGKVEPGETALAAAIRELHEETAVRAELTQHVGLFQIEAGSIRYDIDCFTGPLVSGEARAGSDAAAVAWVHHSEVAQRQVAPNIVEAVARARIMLGL